MVQTALALVIFLLPLAYSPGPGNMFFAANGARFGFRSTIPANVGYHLATWIVTAGIGFGFIAALERYPGIFVALQFAGSPGNCSDRAFSIQQRPRDLRHSSMASSC